MLCNQILDKDGKVSRIYLQLVEKHGGNEDAALDDYIRFMHETDVRFQLSGNPLNEMFLKHDLFTDEEEQNLRAHGHENYIHKTKIDGENKWQYTDGFGRKQYVEEADYQDAVEGLIESRRSFANGFASRFKELLSFYPDVDSEKKLRDKVKELFGDVPMQAFYALIDGLQVGKITSLEDLQEKPFYDPALAEEKVFIHDDAGVYTLILPTPATPDSAYTGHGKFSFMKRFFGNVDFEARRKGYTIDGDMEGRKELAAAMAAVRIKMHNSDARFASVRFAALNFNGMSMDMDLSRGIKNIMALAKDPDHSHLLPADIKDFVLSDKMKLDEFELDYVTQLLGRVTALSSKSKAHAEMLRYMTGGDRYDKIKAVQKRMYWLQKNEGDRSENNKPRYMDATTPPGKEYLILAKSLEQLELQHHGIDRRTLNTEILIGDNIFSRGLKSTTDIANQTVTMVMQGLQRYMDASKSYWKQSYYPKKKKVFEKYLKHKSLGGKERLLNDSEDYYQNLFQKQSLKVVKDGKFTGQTVDANLLRMQDPDDTANGLQQWEREFIREVVGIMKDSIVRFIDKRIDDGVLSNYKTGEEWYAEHYKSQELLLPVLRKDFISKLFGGGVKDIKEGIDGVLEETLDNLVVATGRSLDWGSKDNYGVANSQKGGAYGSNDRMGKLGLADHNGELVVVNPKANRSASIDIEKIMDYSQFANEKMRYERELQTLYDGAKVILQHQENRKGQEMKSEHLILDHLFKNLVLGWREELTISGNVNVGRYVDAARKATSTLTLTGNVGSIFLNTMGNTFAILTTSLAQRFGKHFFNGKDLAKAIATVKTPKGLKKMNDLIDIFLFHETDEVDMLFSDKFKQGQKGIWKSRYGMLPLSMVDRMTRGMILVSQLIHEDLYNNFEYDKEGNIFYNWNKDKRSDAIKKEIIRSQEVIGREPLPYDSMQIRSLTSIAAKMFGSYTDNDKAYYQTIAAGQAFMQFRGYIAGRVKDLYTKGFDNTNIQWYEMDGEGKVKTSVYYQEGILQSFVAMGSELAKHRNLDNLKPEQLGNLRKLGLDMAMFTLMGIAYAGLRELDDEDKDKRSLLMYTQYAWMDVMGTYNLGEYTMMMGAPVFIDKLHKASAATWSYMTFDFDLATRQSINLFGPTKTAKQAVDLLGQ